MAITHQKDEFSKIRESICNGPLEAPNRCHILSSQLSPMDSLYLN